MKPDLATIAKLLTAFVIAVAGVIHTECGRRAERADRIAMQRGLNAEADDANQLRDANTEVRMAVRHSVTWSSYPARIILEWC
jgi:hypothetical protein